MTIVQRICVVTGTRADYGLLYWTIKGIQEAPEFDLRLVVTGMHMSPEFGLTWRTVEDDGFPISEKLEILLSSDTSVGVSKAVGLAIMSLSEAFTRIEPDIVLLVGDRYETFAAAVAATICRIPIAHLSGGETTEGAIDEAFRHSITKMAHVHFPATDAYRDRVIQLGEHPETVHVVGALGLEHLRRTPLLDRREVELEIDREFADTNLLVTYHPVTLEPDTAEDQFDQLLMAVESFRNSLTIFTKSNSDAGGRIVNRKIDGYVKDHPASSVSVTSMGHNLYLSAMKQVDAVVGNSSSGIIEAPSLGTATVNIGDRQRGRIAATSVISCLPDRDSIVEAIELATSTVFRESLSRVSNPYDSGDGSAGILEVLASAYPHANLKKAFFDLEAPAASF